MTTTREEQRDAFATLNYRSVAKWERKQGREELARVIESAADEIDHLRSASQAGGVPADVIVAAYKRGWHWNNENEGDDTFLNKAANDYADKVLSAAAPAAVVAGGVPDADERAWKAICAMNKGEWCASACLTRAACGCADMIAAEFASPPPPATDGDALREALRGSMHALQALLNAVKTNPAMQGRQYIDLGIQVNTAIDKARNVLASSPPLAAAESEGLVQSTVQDNGSVIGPVCQWQPIETAPEGRKVLVSARLGEHPHTMTARFWPTGSLQVEDEIPGAEEIDGELCVPAGWYEESHGDDNWINRINPTHWMPLPPAPGSSDRTNAPEAQSGSLNQALPASSVSVTDAVEAERAIADIAAERRRQVAVEGWTPGHDDKHEDGEIARAAAAYCISGSNPKFYATMPVIARERPEVWPWSFEWWKPKGARQDLVRAGALIVAEIERLDRTELRARGTDEVENG